MFRYLCLAWNVADAGESAVAQRLADILQANASWRRELQAPGLAVFVGAAAPGTNQVHRLGADRGVVVGKLFRRSDLMSPSPRAAEVETGEALQILDAGGQLLIDHFWGRYLAFMLTPQGTVQILRDPSGGLPCLLLRHAGVSIICSWLEDVLSHLPEVPHPRIDLESLRAYLLLGACAHRTALIGVDQVLPGERWHLRGDRIERQLLWNPVEMAGSPSTLQGAAASIVLRDTVRACVRHWAMAYPKIVLRLSGGVDSSIIASCLTPEDTPTDVLCLNFRTSGATADERRYARLAARRAGRKLTELEAAAGFRLERLLSLPRTPVPFGYIGRMGTARLDASVAAAFGAPALFAGTGGDQLFFEFQEWWPGADYLQLRGFDRGFPAAAMAAARLGGVSLWRALGMALQERWRPTGALLEPGRHYSLLAPDALPNAAQTAAYRHPALRAARQLPIGKFNQLQQLMQPISHCDPFELDAAPEPVNPLLSQPLVELALSLPTYVLAHGGRGRGLARMAFAKDIPAEIARRRSKGDMNQFVTEVLLQNREFASSLLLEGELMRHRLIDPKRVREALSNRPTALETHVGEIHHLISIEAWMRRWSAAP